MLGVNFAFWHWQKIDKQILMRTISSLWITYVRLEFDFFGQHDELRYDEIINALQNAGIIIVWLLSGITPGTIHHLSSRKPIDLVWFEHYISYMTHRYHLPYRQIRNEQNTLRFWWSKPNPQDYAKLLIMARKYIPIWLVCWAVMWNDTSHLWWIQYGWHLAKTLDIVWDIDILSFHPYSMWCYVWWKNIITTTCNLIDTFYQNFQHHNKPIRITEFGISRRWTHIDIWSAYREIYKHASTYDMPFFLRNICDLYDKYYSRRNPEKYFGLLYPDGTPTQTYDQLYKYIHS